MAQFDACAFAARWSMPEAEAASAAGPSDLHDRRQVRHCGAREVA
jgi:hypothetical protein